MTNIVKCLGVVLLISSSVSSLYGKSVFLNGIDVTSAKNQSLKNVNVRIAENGDVYIDAPHYEAKQEKTYLPLSRNTLGEPQKPEHRPSQVRLPKVEENVQPPLDAIEKPASP